MANQTVYPYGTDGELPSSIGIINDLTTGGADKALAAEQGKVLNKELSEAKVTEIDISSLQVSLLSLYSNKVWGGSKGVQSHVVIPCSEGDQFSIEPIPEGTNNGNWYGWLSSAYVPPKSAGTTPYVTGCDRVWLNGTDAPITITAPSGAAYLCLVLTNGATAAADRTCSWKIYKIESMTAALVHDVTKTDLDEALTYDDGRTKYEKVGHYSLAGDGSTYVSLSMGELEVGATYKLVIDDLGWPVYGLASGGQYTFDIRYVNSAGTWSSPVHVRYGGDYVLKEYVFTAEEDAKEYRYGGRCPVGKSIDVTLYKQVQRPQRKEVTDDIIRLIRQAKFNDSAGVLGLLHYSDIHGDTIAANHLLTAISDLDGYLNDVIATGDSVYYYSSDLPWWTGCGLPEKSLYVLGNHDGRVGSNLDGEGKAWAFQNYFEPYIEALEYDMPDGYDDSTSVNYKACYWSKDYPSANIRLIGVDGVHRFYGTVNPETGEVVSTGYGSYTNEQELWLISKLNETLDEESDVYGYSVLIAGHYCLDPFSGDNNITNNSATGGSVVDFRTSARNNFHLYSNNSYSINGTRFDYRSYNASGIALTNNNFANIVMNWKNRGGKFIAWLCGHMHFDLFYYPTNYPELLCVSINQAGWRRESGFENRETPFDGRLCANYYAVDATSGLFKIIRIGKHDDRFLGPKNYLCYDYINKKVIFEG